MTMFIILGIIMTISMGLFMSLILTSGMNDGAFKNVLTVIIALLIGFGITGLLFTERNYEEKKWNNGICTYCDTKWHLQTVTRNKSSRTYIYTCENGHLLETSNFFQKN